VAYQEEQTAHTLLLLLLLLSCEIKHVNVCANRSELDVAVNCKRLIQYNQAAANTTICVSQCATKVLL
jgi:hypothetical protein